jgi:hypothetical protein
VYQSGIVHIVNVIVYPKKNKKMEKFGGPMRYVTVHSD